MLSLDTVGTRRYVKETKTDIYQLYWLGGSVVRAMARDRKVASSTPGQSAAR